MKPGDIIADDLEHEYVFIEGGGLELTDLEDAEHFMRDHIRRSIGAVDCDGLPDSTTHAIVYRLVPIRRVALVVLEVRPDDLPDDDDDRYELWPHGDADYIVDPRIIDARPDWLREAMDEAATREGDAVAAALLRVVGEVVP